MWLDGGEFCRSVRHDWPVKPQIGGKTYVETETLDRDEAPEEKPDFETLVHVQRRSKPDAPMVAFSNS